MSGVGLGGSVGSAPACNGSTLGSNPAKIRDTNVLYIKYIRILTEMHCKKS
jgi:hypothetical protein